MNLINLRLFSVCFRMLIASIFLLLVCVVPAQADSISDILSPGDVIKGHSKIESECAKCHKKFDKAAQSGLCKDCHKDVAKDIADKHAYHGHIKEAKECKECHKPTKREYVSHDSRSFSIK